MRIHADLNDKVHNFQTELSTFEKIKYIFHFIAQAFLYAVFVFFIGFGLVMALYFGDLVYNLSKGNNNFIKVIKRIAFGFRSFKRFKARIMICKGLIKIKKIANA